MERCEVRHPCRNTSDVVHQLGYRGVRSGHDKVERAAATELKHEIIRVARRDDTDHADDGRVSELCRDDRLTREIGPALGCRAIV